VQTGVWVLFGQGRKIFGGEDMTFHAVLGAPIVMDDAFMSLQRPTLKNCVCDLGLSFERYRV
jgi:hypothetical protein